MPNSAIEDKRNVALVGHGASGKTTLTEAMLYFTGATDRMGSVEEGNTVSDFLPEEQERGNSINSSVLPIDYDGYDISLIDTPGFVDFVGEMVSALRVVDGAALVINGEAGLEPQAITAWDYCEDYGVPRVIFVNRLDEEKADYGEVIDNLDDFFDKAIAPLALPVLENGEVQGLINLLDREMVSESEGETETSDPPDDMADTVDEFREQLVDAIVERDDELMMAYLEGEDIELEKLRETLRTAVLDGNLIPVIGGSAVQQAGSSSLLDLITRYLPDPSYREQVEGIHPDSGESEVRETSADAPFSARVFKQQFDSDLGEITFFRIYSGEVNSGDNVLNSNSDAEERMGSMMRLKGRERITETQAEAGDILATVKLKETGLGDTLCDTDNPLVFPRIEFPSTLSFERVVAGGREELENAASGLTQLTSEDPTLRTEQNRETGQLVLHGMGQLHLEVARSRLKQRYDVEIDFDKPDINYRESIKRPADGYGRFKKQSGGRGQFGDVYLEIAPISEEEAANLEEGKKAKNIKERTIHELDWGGVMVFENDVKGGVIPTKFIPSVEKGVLETMENGLLAGYPARDIRARVYDGKHHPVDSSEVAFKNATRIAIEDAIDQADPYLLEPVQEVSIIVPDEFTGDVMGDLNSRRGRVQGVDSLGGNQQRIRCRVPLAEMYHYINTLRSITQGRGSFEMEFSHYQEVPREVAEKIIARKKKKAEAS